MGKVRFSLPLALCGGCVHNRSHPPHAVLQLLDYASHDNMNIQKTQTQ